MKTDPVLAETIEALEMPREGLLKWIRRSNDRYCLSHGGRKYYAELMDLYDEILSAEEAKHSS